MGGREQTRAALEAAAAGRPARRPAAAGNQQPYNLTLPYNIMIQYILTTNKNLNQIGNVNKQQPQQQQQQQQHQQTTTTTNYDDDDDDDDDDEDDC